MNLKNVFGNEYGINDMYDNMDGCIYDNDNSMYNGHNVYNHDYDCNFQEISAPHRPQYVLASTFDRFFRAHSMIVQLVYLQGHQDF